MPFVIPAPRSTTCLVAVGFDRRRVYVARRAVWGDGESASVVHTCGAHVNPYLCCHFRIITVRVAILTIFSQCALAGKVQPVTPSLRAARAMLCQLGVITVA